MYKIPLNMNPDISNNSGKKKSLIKYCMTNNMDKAVNYLNKRCRIPLS